ncbi:uncharacterized protein [Clytia hemisphaerica]|uniref:Uncharacterized protein n=1 Tax=Clytia hemisphaerica TaxID=252671 RepID=A0A7M5WVY0_9CNID
MMTSNQRIRLVWWLFCLSIISSICGSKTTESKVNRSKRNLGGILQNTELPRGKKGEIFEATLGKLTPILSSYHLDKAAEDAFPKNLEELSKTSKTYHSIPEVALRGTKGTAAIYDIVMKNLIAQQKDIPNLHDGAGLTLYRGDDRNADQIIQANGFFGFAPITVEHARLIAPYWQNMAMAEKWRVQTGIHGPMPFVATTPEKSPPKGKYQYEITVPIPKERAEGLGVLLLHEGTNEKDFSKSNIIALRMNGHETDFVTGIPLKWIVGCRKEEKEEKEYLPLTDPKSSCR